MALGDLDNTDSPGLDVDEIRAVHAVIEEGISYFGDYLPAGRIEARKVGSQWSIYFDTGDRKEDFFGADQVLLSINLSPAPKLWKVIYNTDQAYALRTVTIDEAEVAYRVNQPVRVDIVIPRNELPDVITHASIAAIPIEKPVDEAERQELLGKIKEKVQESDAKIQEAQEAIDTLKSNLEADLKALEQAVGEGREALEQQLRKMQELLNVEGVSDETKEMLRARIDGTRGFVAGGGALDQQVELYIQTLKQAVDDEITKQEKIIKSYEDYKTDLAEHRVQVENAKTQKELEALKKLPDYIAPESTGEIALILYRGDLDSLDANGDGLVNEIDKDMIRNLLPVDPRQSIETEKALNSERKKKSVFMSLRKSAVRFWITSALKT